MADQRIVELSRGAFVELCEALEAAESWSAGEIGRPSRIFWSGADLWAMKNKLVFVPKPPAPELPNRTMQELIDVGFNAFGLQLFAESVAGETDAKTFNPFSFKFRNIKITLEPDGVVDTSHH